MLCHSNIELSKNVVGEIVQRLNEGNDIVYGNYRVGEKEVHIPNFSPELLYSYPLLISGIIGIKRSYLSKIFHLKIHWEFMILLNAIRNSWNVFSSKSRFFRVDESLYCHVDNIQETDIRGELIKHGTIEPIKEDKSIGFRLVSSCISKNKALCVIPTRNYETFNSSLIFNEEELKISNLDMVVVHHEPDGKWDDRIINVCRSKEIPVIKMSGPFNYSKMNNDAIRKYRNEKHRFFILLNDDVLLKIGSFNEMMQVFDYRWNKVGIVGSKLLYPNNGTIFPPNKDTTIQHAGVQLLKDKRCAHRLRYKKCTNLSSNILKECHAVTFALVCIDAKCYDDVGGLDETLPNDYNDIDFCIKASRKGWKIIYNPEALAYHLESVSRKQYGDTGDPKGKQVFAERYKNLLALQMTLQELRGVEMLGF